MTAPRKQELQYQDTPADPKGYLPPPRDKDHPFYVRSSYKAKRGEKLYEATGESGQIAVQSHKEVMTHALSWADPDYPGERAGLIRAGVVRNFYRGLKEAQQAKALMERNYPHCTFVIVEAREYRGKK